MDAFVGVGSNQNDPGARCIEAVERLGETEHLDVVRCSPWYLTEPVGPVAQPPFVNGVVLVETSLPPSGLLSALMAIETGMGRKRRIRWGPRIIDLDLLLYGDRILDEPGLTIPHPEMHRRRFVLAPLCDLAPDRAHPILHRTFYDLLTSLDDDRGVSRLAR